MGLSYLAKNIETLPYPMQKVLNQGCEIPKRVSCRWVNLSKYIVSWLAYGRGNAVHIHEKMQRARLSKPISGL